MWNTIKRNWNATVRPFDEVWIIGDLTLKGPDHLPTLTKMIESLNGFKHMIKAPTHDRLTIEQYIDMGFVSVHYPAVQLPNGWYLGHDPALAAVWPKDSIYICGHVHQLMTSQKSNTDVLMINVGVDVRNFTPVSEEQILEIIKNGESKPQSKAGGEEWREAREASIRGANK